MTNGRQGTASHLASKSSICDILMFAVSVYLLKLMQQFTKNNILHSDFPNIGKWNLLRLLFPLPSVFSDYYI